MLTCFKLNFSLLGQKDNYFSYVYIFLFILDIILIIINEISLEKKIFNQMINYCKEYILKNNSNDDNLKNKEFKKLRNIYLNEKQKKKLKMKMIMKIVIMIIMHI